MRTLLGLLGVIAIGAGAATGVAEIRDMRASAGVVSALLITGICALIIVGGAILLRGAFRGQITVRRPGHRPPII